MGDIKSLYDYPDIDFIDGYTLERLESEMIADYKKCLRELTGKEQELAKADKFRILLQVAALYIFQGYMYTDDAAKMGLLKYARGDYLENLGAFKRVARKAETSATVTLRYALLEARASATGIPKGSRVSAGDGVYFATNEYAEIPAGELYIDVRATCTTAGESGNLYGAGEITRMVDGIPFVDSVKNITAPENGADQETEEEYRESIYIAPENYAAAGPEAAYTYYVKQYSSQIKDVKVKSPSPRVVLVRCLLENGELPGEEFLSGLKEYIEDPEIKMLTDTVEVMNPDIVEYEVELEYYINQSDKNQAETIQKKVGAAVQEYVLWQKSKIGRDINDSKLSSLVVAAGAKRVKITSPEFTKIGDEAVAVATDVNVTYGGVEDD